MRNTIHVPLFVVVLFLVTGCRMTGVSGVTKRIPFVGRFGGVTKRFYMPNRFYKWQVKKALQKMVPPTQKTLHQLPSKQNRGLELTRVDLNVAVSLGFQVIAYGATVGTLFRLILKKVEVPDWVRNHKKS